MINELLNDVSTIISLQDLMSEKNMVRNDDDVLEFVKGDKHLTFTNTENGFSVLFENIEKEDNYREEFTKFCDSIDDEVFQESCNMYSKEFGSLEELNSNLNKEGIINFVNCVRTIVTDKVNVLRKYYNDARDYLSNL